MSWIFTKTLQQVSPWRQQWQSFLINLKLHFCIKCAEKSNVSLTLASFPPIQLSFLFILQRARWTGILIRQDIDFTSDRSVHNGDVKLACNPRSVLLTDDLFQGFTLLPEWCVCVLNVEMFENVRQHFKIHDLKYRRSDVNKRTSFKKMAKWDGRCLWISPVWGQSSLTFLAETLTAGSRNLYSVFSPPSQARGAPSQQSMNVNCL